VYIREGFCEIIDALLPVCREVYGQRLVTLAVFGSVGRGTPCPDSDIDLLLVAHDLPRGRLRRMDEFGLVEERVSPLLDTLRGRGIETVLSPVIKTCEEVQWGSPLFMDMIEDACILFDRGHFFTHYLRHLDDLLTRVGARRVERGGSWYWVFDTQHTIDEVFSK